MNHKLRTFLVFAFILKCLASSGQIAPPEPDSLKYKAYLGGYPIIFYLPETSWSFGAGGVFNFYTTQSENLNPSQILVGGAYTLKKQILSYASYKLFFRDNDINIFGEVGYYEYFYPYFGIGDMTDAANEESYSADYPRFQVHYLQRVYKKFAIGGLYHFDNYRITEIAEDGLIARNQPTGFSGSIISKVGLLMRYDNRDKVFYPSNGTFATLQLTQNITGLGATESFTSFDFDVSTYKSLKKGILVFNFWSGRSFGDIPFQELFQLGGGRKARGIIKGRFRDKSIALIQSEYRFDIWKRFAGAVFGSYGATSDSLSQILSSDWKFNYGAGLRFFLDKVNRTALRLDFAFGSDDFNFYFTVGEAF